MTRILVVDDERPVRELISTVLRDAGYEVTTAVHGAEALALVAEAPPDLILTDLMMPVMGGADLCRRLKAAAATRVVPVILMSALPSGATTGAGEDAFLGKPFDLVELEGLVGRCLGRSRA